MEKPRKIEVETKTFIRFWLVLLGFGAIGFLLFKARTGLIILGAALFPIKDSDETDADDGASKEDA